MKNFYLYVSAFSLLAAGSAYAALDCAALPSCSDLGYTDTVSQCPKNSNGVAQVIKCPFDTTQGKCVFEAAIDQIAYFSKAPASGSGWLKCDGATYSTTKYPDLFTRIGTQFCNVTAGSSSACSGSTFAVPNYQGYFLRVYGTPNSTYGKVGNTSLTAPQKEGVPDITANGGWGENSDDLRNRISGAFYLSSTKNHQGCGDSDWDNHVMNFQASKSNSIYGASTGVTPVNVAVYAYIFAGRIAQ